jgi:hypothetical protein
MGFKAIELAPLGQVSAITPPSKDVRVKAFSVARTDTTATVKAMLPFNSTIIDFLIFGAASNAGTTATLSIGSSVTSTEYVNAQDVKTAGGLIRPTSTVSATNLPNLDNIPQSGDVQIWSKYAESGTASSAGGPYTVIVFYVM